jgi:hypothetical protein
VGIGFSSRGSVLALGSLGFLGGTLAGQAVTTATPSDAQIVAFEEMSPQAMRLRSVCRREGVATQDVLARGDGAKMFGIDAVRAYTALLWEPVVVDVLTWRYGVNPMLI